MRFTTRLTAWLAASLGIGLSIGMAVCSKAHAQTTGPETCKTGLVWREACGPNDHVCVTPAVRDQALADNAAAAQRRAVSAQGPDSCATGYVWREACGPQDHVCVLPAAKAQATADNAAASTRYVTRPVLWDVLTQHNDPARSGANLAEKILRPDNVTPSTFGRLLERHVDGQIITQPLYVSAQSVPGKGLRNVVYVTTRKNWVYAFDADDLNPDPLGGLIWSRPIQVSSASTVPFMCSETIGPVGVSSTPVIDRATDTLYLVARHADGSVWLHALDIATGLPKAGTPGKVQIKAPGFWQALQLNRAALLLQNGALFIGFAALNCDNPGWRGWVFAYRAPDLRQIGVFSTSDGSPPGAGIWQSGSGLVGDGRNVYFMTGNRQGGGPKVPDGMLDESFVKLAVGPAPDYGLTLAGHYTVSNRPALNESDSDLGSGGPNLLPGGRIVGGGKQGKLYVLQTATMAPAQNPPTSGPVPPGGSDGFQAYINSWHADSSRPVCTDISLYERECYIAPSHYDVDELFGPNIHGSGVYWSQAEAGAGLYYMMPEKDYLRAYRYDPLAGRLATQPALVSTVRSPDGMPGSFISLSADGARAGIIWALIPKWDGQWSNVPGRMVAFDARTLHELWRDDDNIGFSKFTAPTVAGGKVFRPTFADKLVVYGLKPGGASPRCDTIDEKHQNYTGNEGLLKAATGSVQQAADGIGQYRNHSGGTIYWTAATCAHEVHGPILRRWDDLGREQSPLGYPTSDETRTPDGRGRFNAFQNGAIYWTALTGAHEVLGPIFDRWRALGAERSALGYPLSDETDEADGSGRFTVFEHGTVHWQRATGATTVKAQPEMLISAAHGDANRPGADVDRFVFPPSTTNATATTVCQQRCADDDRCTSWSLGRALLPGVTSSTCRLKAGTPPLERFDLCCVSGIKVPQPAGAVATMEGRIDRPGSDFASFQLPQADPRLCQGECALQGACRAWTYVEADLFNGPRCRLKHSVPDGVAHPLSISGMR